MIRSYVFLGDFMPLVRGRISQGRVFDDHAQTRINFLRVIDSQHGCDRKFLGKLNLKLLLLLPFPDGTGIKKKDDMNMMFHTNKPSLSLFIRTLEELLADVLFNDGSIIVSVEAEKRKAKEPRVEFILTEIE